MAVLTPGPIIIQQQHGTEEQSEPSPTTAPTHSQAWFPHLHRDLLGRGQLDGEEKGQL